MQIEVDTVKGFQDYLPPESLKRNAVKKVIEEYFKIYGFVPVETPVIEFDEIMKPDSLTDEDDAVSDRFRLKDRAGRNLGLRYEFTFQLARIFKKNPNMKLPFRRYQIGENFRDEPVGTGRYRQFVQCDIDIIGDSSRDAEAECLSCVSEILKQLKIESEIQVNNRKLLKSIIESVEIKEINGVMRELDKIDKLPLDDIKSNLRKFADTNQIITLLKLLEKDLKFFIDNAFDGAQELQELITLARQYGVDLIFNPFMIRGLSYYTGNIFEVKNGKQAIAGGGRYDKVVGKFLGKEIPAVGISFGLERVTELAKIAPEPVPKVIIISINQTSLAFKTLKKLRKEKISCVMESGGVVKALEYANSLNIPYAVFIGKEEISKQKFKLRNMISGEEKLVSEKLLIKTLK